MGYSKRCGLRRSGLRSLFRKLVFFCLLLSWYCFSNYLILIFSHYSLRRCFRVSSLPISSCITCLFNCSFSSRYRSNLDLYSTYSSKLASPVFYVSHRHPLLPLLACIEEQVKTDSTSLCVSHPFLESSILSTLDSNLLKVPINCLQTSYNSGPSSLPSPYLCSSPCETVAQSCSQRSSSKDLDLSCQCYSRMFKAAGLFFWMSVVSRRRVQLQKEVEQLQSDERSSAGKYLEKSDDSSAEKPRIYSLILLQPKIKQRSGRGLKCLLKLMLVRGYQK